MLTHKGATRVLADAVVLNYGIHKRLTVSNRSPERVASAHAAFEKSARKFCEATGTAFTSPQSTLRVAGGLTTLRVR